MRFLSLFAGIGGLDLGLERSGMTCVGQVEIDPFCRRVLAKHWPNVWRHDDVRTLSRELVREHCGHVDLICGGFPCQDISCANHRGLGIDGPRSGLWREFHRLIGDLRPALAVVENVPALAGRGLCRVLGDLAEIGYDAEWDCVSVCDFGGDIERKRLFIVAFAESQGWPEFLCGKSRFGVAPHPAWGSPDSLDTPVDRRNRIEAWLGQPAIFGSPYGIPSRLAEWMLGAYGNAVCPQVGEWIGRRIMEVSSHSG
jgi:DNA (cytosine-5)-methyltransferase 1